MGRRVGEKPFQISMSPKVMTALEVAASYHKDDVDRDRAMQKGPMLAYVARWFVTLARADQLEVIQTGKRLTEGDLEGEDIPPFGDPSIPAGVMKNPSKGVILLSVSGERTGPKPKRKNKPTKAD